MTTLGFKQIIEACEEKLGTKLECVDGGWRVQGNIYLRPVRDRLHVCELRASGEETEYSSIGMAAPKQLVESFANELSLFVRSMG
jgi:hypothetical protein